MSKKIIYGDTVGTTMPRPDWTEENERSAAYIKNKPTEDIERNTEARHTHNNKDFLDNITEDIFKNFVSNKSINNISGIRFSGALNSGRYNVFTAPMERLAITSLLNVDGADTIPEYVCIFTSGHAGLPTRLSLPRDVKWVNDDVPQIKANYKYIVRIFDGVASYSEVIV